MGIVRSRMPSGTKVSTYAALLVETLTGRLLLHQTCEKEPSRCESDSSYQGLKHGHMMSAMARYESEDGGAIALGVVTGVGKLG